MSFNEEKIAIVSAIDFTLRVLLTGQIKAIQHEGFEVHGVCSPGQDFQTLREMGVLMFSVTVKRSISPFSDLVALWRMYRYFKRQKISIVHTHTPKVSLLGQLAAKLAGVPIIVNTIHGFYFHEYMKPLVRRFYVAMEWIAARCSTIILCQNPEDIETAVKLGICKRNKIKLLGNGVDLSIFDPFKFDDEFKRKKRSEIGVPEEAVVVGIIGRLVKEKGYLELFKAMRDIMAKNKNVWLVIIGPEEPEKSDRISSDKLVEYNITSQTCWLGERYDVAELLACCDVYTLPSWREGFPRSAIEAAAMALPVVATNIRGCRQVVEDGLNGILVPVRNSTSLACAIKQLIGDEQLRLKMGKAGYEKSRREFDEQDVCKIVLDTYTQLLEKN
ncbi:MAG: glycosyltransferase family 4 protein [Planctomycetota bacterium]|jgi:glycosyltransferase involved in cell wall biosynthesis